MENNKKSCDVNFRWKSIGRNKTALQISGIEISRGLSFPNENSYYYLYFYNGDLKSVSDIDNMRFHSVRVSEKYKGKKTIKLSDSIQIELAQNYLDSEQLHVFVNGLPTCIVADNIPSFVNNSDGYSPVILENCHEFESVWDIPKNKYTLELPLSKHGKYNCFVDWGDGSQSSIKNFNDNEKFHVYNKKGEYKIKIFGKFRGLTFENNSSATNIIEITKWGCLDLNVSQKNDKMFLNCDNLKISATDSPLLGDNTNFHKCFMNCGSLKEARVSNWNVSKIKNFSFMFANCKKFNEDLSEWNTRTANDFSSMFMNCVNFNSALSTKYNKDFDYYTWNVSNVTNMNKMFAGAVSFNRSLASWNVSNVKDFGQMFNLVKLDSNKYSKMLFAWSRLNLQNITNEESKFSGGRSFFTLDAEDVRNSVKEKIGCSDSGKTNGYSIGIVKFVTITRLKNNSDINVDDINDVELWDSIKCKNNKMHINAFVLPISTFESDVYEFLLDAFENRKIIDKKNLHMCVKNNTSTENFSQTWRPIVGMSSLANKTSPKNELPTDISELIDTDFTNIQRINFILNLRNYVVSSIEDYEPKKLPHKTNEFHLITQSEGKRTLTRVQSVGVDYQESAYSYINDVSFASCFGYDKSNTNANVNCGNLIYRDNSYCKFVVFGVLASNDEYLNGSSDKILDCMISYKLRERWQNPRPLSESILGCETKFKSVFNDAVLGNAFGFYFNDELNMLVISSKDQIVLLRYNLEINKFEVFNNINYENKNKVTAVILNNKNVLVPGEKSKLFLYKNNNYETTKEYGVKCESNRNTENNSIIYFDTNNQSLSSFYTELEEQELLFSKINLNLKNLTPRIKHTAVGDECNYIENGCIKHDLDARYEYLFGHSQRNKTDWSISASQSKYKIFYYNKSELESNTQGVISPLLVSDGTKFVKNEIPSTIIKTMCVGDILISVELDNLFSKSAFETTSSFYLENLFVRLLQIEEGSLKLKNISKRTLLKDLLGSKCLFKIVSRFEKISLIKDIHFGSSFGRLINLSADSNSKEVCFVIS